MTTLWKKIKENFLSLNGGTLNSGASISLHNDEAADLTQITIATNSITLKSEGETARINVWGIKMTDNDTNKVLNSAGGTTDISDLSTLMEFYNTYGNTLTEVAAALQAGKKIVYYEESAS